MRPRSKSRPTRSGGNMAAGSTTVVVLNVRGLMPSMPTSAMIAAAVFSRHPLNLSAQVCGDPRGVVGAILGIRGVKCTNTALVMRELVDFHLSALVNRQLKATTPD